MSPERRVAGDAPGAPSGSGAVRGGHRHRGFHRSLLMVFVLGVGVLAALEVRDRLTHVTETDARVTADLVTVSSRVAGWVTRLAAEEGDTVEENQPLAIIDGRESRLRIRQLDAQIQATESEKERLEAERELIDRQTATRYETQRKRLSATTASVSALEAQLELAQSELARSQSLFEKRVTPRQQLEQARAEARRIEGQHRMAVAEMEEAEAQLHEARAERARLQVLDRELDMLEHQKTRLRVRLEQQKLDLADRTIRSPVTGVVDRVFVESGEYVTPGQRLAIVHDPERVWVEANIKETAIRKLAVGQRVAITVDAFPDADFIGEVVSIGNATTGSFALLPTPNPSGNFTKITQRLPVRIAIDQQGEKLRPGMMVEVKIDVRSR